MKTLILDTSIIYALFNKKDLMHSFIIEKLSMWDGIIKINDYIIDELLTLISSRINKKEAIIIGNKLFSENLLIIDFIDQEGFQNAFKIFSKYNDKNLSFTDCIIISHAIKSNGQIFTLEKEMQKVREVSFY